MSLLGNISLGKPKRNLFDLGHEVKLSMSMGKLVPFISESMIPGDEFKVKSEILMRFAPMLAPVMHRINVYTHYFFVPYRLIWDQWEEFITGGEDGTATWEVPMLEFDTEDATWGDAHKEACAPGSLADYLGVPPYFDSDPNHPDQSLNEVQVSALPFRAYQQIYNDYYRDQNLTPPVDIPKSYGVATDDDDDFVNVVSLKNRCWEKDYFTSALPWTQRGNPVTLPISGTAPVNRVSGADSWFVYQSGGNSTANSILGVETDANGKLTNTTGGGLSLDPRDGLEADLDNASTTNLNDLRTAARLQQWLEKNARAGARYIEQMFSHFGVVSDDSRLQRAEYVGGGKTPVVISEVLQTSESSVNGPQGNMAGHGMSVGVNHAGKKYAKEHGIFMGIISVLPRTAYQQGIKRELFKRDKYDYFWPEFAQLGEQAVSTKEIDPTNHATGIMTDQSEDVLFGYVPRYDEYRHIQSSVHGDFRSSLNFWHLSRIFETDAALNEEFVEANVSDRIFAVNDYGHNLWVQIYNDIKALRPIPKYNIPTL